MAKRLSEQTVSAIGNILTVRLQELSVIERDEVLCLTRRMLWHTTLAGAPLPRQEGELHAKATAIADFFEGMSLWDVEQAIEHHRMLMWAKRFPAAARVAFQTRKKNRHGRQLR